MTRKQKRILTILAVILVAAGAWLAMRLQVPWEGVIVSAFDKPNPDLEATNYGEAAWRFKLHYWEVLLDGGRTRVVEVPYVRWNRASEGARVRQTRLGRWPEIVGSWKRAPEVQP